MYGRTRTFRLLVVVAILGIVAAACGSDGSDERVEAGPGGPETASAGDTITVTSEGWEPDSEVTITLFSDPIELDTVTSDEDGATSDEVTIPDEVEPGDHDLEFSGTDPDGESRTVRYAIEIEAPDDDAASTTTSVDDATTTTDEDASTTTAATGDGAPASTVAAAAPTTQPTATTRAPTATTRPATTQPPVTAAGTAPRIHDESGKEPSTFVPRDCDAQLWNVIDPDGGPWSVAVAGQPTYGTFHVTMGGSDTTMYYTSYVRNTASYNDDRDDSVRVEVRDASGRSKAYTISIPWTARTPPATGPGAPAPC